MATFSLDYKFEEVSREKYKRKMYEYWYQRRPTTRHTPCIIYSIIFCFFMRLIAIVNREREQKKVTKKLNWNNQHFVMRAEISYSHVGARNGESQILGRRRYSVQVAWGANFISNAAYWSDIIVTTNLRTDLHTFSILRVLKKMLTWLQQGGKWGQRVSTMCQFEENFSLTFIRFSVSYQCWNVGG